MYNEQVYYITINIIIFLQKPTLQTLKTLESYSVRWALLQKFDSEKKTK